MRYAVIASRGFSVVADGFVAEYGDGGGESEPLSTQIIGFHRLGRYCERGVAIELTIELIGRLPERPCRR